MHKANLTTCLGALFIASAALMAIAQADPEQQKGATAHNADGSSKASAPVRAGDSQYDPKDWNTKKVASNSIEILVRIPRICPVNKSIAEVILSNNGKSEVQYKQTYGSPLFSLRLFDVAGKEIMRNKVGNWVLNFGYTAATRMEFGAILPGQSINRQINFSDWYDLQPGNQYRIQVKTPDGKQVDRIVRDGKVLFLQSEKIEFRATDPADIPLGPSKTDLPLDLDG